MGIIEADIALESWLLGFLPCSGQGQLTSIVQNIHYRQTVASKLFVL